MQQARSLIETSDILIAPHVCYDTRISFRIGPPLARDQQKPPISGDKYLAS